MKNRKMYRVPALFLGLCLLLSGCGGGGESGKEATATSMRLRKTEGEVQVNDDQDKSLEAKADLALYSGYGVATEKESYGWVELDSVKLLKMDELSRIGIEKDGGDLKVRLENGNLFFHVAEPLKSDESMEIRTSTMAIGIRGTCGWVEVPQDGSVKVSILEGKVECTAGDKSAFVSAGEAAYIDEGGEIVARKFDVSDIPAFVGAEVEEDENLGQIIREIFSQGESGGGDVSAASGFVPWAEAGLKDHAMDWRDEALAKAMVEMTGISDRDIMLSDVWGMTELVLSEKGISDIRALGELTNLCELNLASNQVSDISALGSLINLSSLEMNSNNINDISALGGLKNLSVLSMGSNNISDISILGDLTNLTQLYIGVNNINDISALGGLENLIVLTMGYNDISDISALSGLTKLDWLAMSGTNVRDIGVLANLTSLRALEIDAGGLDDISVLGGLTNLYQLLLRNNNISDVSALGGLSNLEHLDLSGNPITDYSPVEFVPNLIK